MKGLNDFIEILPKSNRNGNTEERPFPILAGRVQYRNGTFTSKSRYTNIEGQKPPGQGKFQNISYTQNLNFTKKKLQKNYVTARNYSSHTVLGLVQDLCKREYNLDNEDEMNVIYHRDAWFDHGPTVIDITHKVLISVPEKCGTEFWFMLMWPMSLGDRFPTNTSRKASWAANMRVRIAQTIQIFRLFRH